MTEQLTITSPEDIDNDIRQTAENVSKFMKVLANPDRLTILFHLAKNEMCVSEIEAKCDIQQPTLSQQLTILREQKLVTTRRDGRNIYYQTS